MRINTKIVWDMNTGEVLEHEWFEYSGPLALAGGGPSAEQRAAASAQANLSNQAAADSAANEKQVLANYNTIKPFATSMVNNGLSFYPQMTDSSAGMNAQAFAPGRAQLIRSMQNFGDLPSGFKTSQLADYNEGQARAFDNNLMQNALTNQQAREQGAQLLTGQASVLNPLGWSQSAIGGNSSIMNAPLQSAGLGGLLGGAAAGAIQAIPF